jgi:hypothetical protein
MHKIFISYSQSDQEEAKRLVAALRATDIVGWLDAADIAAGASIPSAIRNALLQSSAMVVLLSPSALQSNWVQFEIGAAEALGKKIIPVIISGGLAESGLPEILKDRKVIDARNRPKTVVAEEINIASKSSL